MEALEIQLHTFRNSTPRNVERSTPYRNEAVQVLLHKLLNSTPEQV